MMNSKTESLGLSQQEEIDLYLQQGIRDSLAAYAVFAFKDIILSKHHETIIQHLEAIEAGEIKRLIIVAPPRHTKSLLVSELSPPWMLGKNPSRQIMCATYGQELSLSFGRKVKQQMINPQFQQVFPECVLREDSKASNRLETTARGVYTATSIGGAVTGKGADVLIIDDPVKDRATAESRLQSDVAWDWFRSTARTRLQPNGAIIVMATRWTEHDITGRILEGETGKDYTMLHLPAIADDEISALWPEWMSLQDLIEIRGEIGDYEFEALYQGRPAQREGGMMKVDRIQYYDCLPLNSENKPIIKRIIKSLDSANKATSKNDYSVLATGCESSNGMYLLDLVRGRYEYPELKAMLRNEWKKEYYERQAELMVVEDKASGTQVIQEFRQEGINVIPFNPSTDKVIRASPLSATIEAGNFYLPRNHPMNNAILAELRSFPNGMNDDIVDGLAMMHDKLKKFNVVKKLTHPGMRR